MNIRGPNEELHKLMQTLALAGGVVRTAVFHIMILDLAWNVLVRLGQMAPERLVQRSRHVHRDCSEERCCLEFGVEVWLA